MVVRRPQPPTAAQTTAAATAAQVKKKSSLYSPKYKEHKANQIRASSDGAPGLSKLASAAAAAVAGVPLDAAEKAAVLKTSRKEGQVKPTRTNWSKGENLQKMTAACDARRRRRR